MHHPSVPLTWAPYTVTVFGPWSVFGCDVSHLSQQSNIMPEDALGQYVCLQV